MSGMRAGCVENIFRGPNPVGFVPNVFRQMPGTGLTPNAFRLVPGLSTANATGPLLFRRATELMGWAGGDISGGRGRTRSTPFMLLGPGGRGESGFAPSSLGPGGRGESSFAPSLFGPGGRGRGESGYPAALLGPGGRGESGYPAALRGPGGRGEAAPQRRASEGAPGSGAAGSWNSSWQGTGWGRNEARAGMGGGFPEGPGGMQQQQQSQPFLPRPTQQQQQSQPLLPRPTQQSQQQSQPLLPRPTQQQSQQQSQPLLPRPTQQQQQQQSQQQSEPLLPRPTGRGLVHLGDRFVPSELELQRLHSLIQREAQKRGAPWVLALSRAVEEISEAAEEEMACPIISSESGENQGETRSAAVPSAVAVPLSTSVPALTPSDGMPEQSRRVWIAGHSAIASASKRACSSSYGQHLGLAANGVHVLWMDKHGVRSDELLPALLRQAEVQPWPDALVIHLGCNDFEQISGIRLIKCIKKDLVFLNTTYPKSKIIWSDILPNRRRRREKYLDRSRKKVNKQISDFVRSLGGMQIRHEFFSAECASLYKEDGVHLSDIGNDLFNMMLQGAIKSAFGIV